MTALELQTYLANTAHQREVADLQAAGLNPVLSAGSSGAAVPNVMSGSGEVSAKAVAAAGKANPLNKALGIIEKVVTPDLVDPRLSKPKPGNPNSGLGVVSYVPNSGEFSFNQGIPMNALSSYANSMANAVAPVVTGLITSGIGGPAAGLSSGTVVRLVQNALKPLQRTFRNSAVAVQNNQNIHDADYARNLLGRK